MNKTLFLTKRICHITSYSRSVISNFGVIPNLLAFDSRL